MRTLRYIATHRAARELLLLAVVALTPCTFMLFVAEMAVNVHLYATLGYGRQLTAGGMLAVAIVAGVWLERLIGKHMPPDTRIDLGLWTSAAAMLLLPASAGPASMILLMALLAVGATATAAGIEQLRRRLVSRRIRWIVIPAIAVMAAIAAALVAARMVAGVRGPAAGPGKPGLALAWLACVLVLAATLIVHSVVRYRRAPVGPARWFCFSLLRFASSLWHGMTRKGRATVPVHGPAVVAATHVSALDPVLLQASCRRLLQWIIAREYFDIRGLGWAYRLAGCVPVRRGQHDVGAQRAALRVLAEGGVVGIFPAGGIRLPDEPARPLLLGAARLALRARVPLVPVRIVGLAHRGMVADWLGRHHDVVVEWGAPIELTDLYGRHKERAALIEATRRLAAFLGGRPVGADHNCSTESPGSDDLSKELAEK